MAEIEEIEEVRNDRGQTIVKKSVKTGISFGSALAMIPIMLVLTTVFSRVSDSRFTFPPPIIPAPKRLIQPNSISGTQ